MVSNRGALAGATSFAGWGSNVSAADFQPSSRASADHAAQDLAVARMHAVEIADRDGARTEIVRRFRQAAINHATLLMPRLHFDLQPVVSQPHMRRQTLLRAACPRSWQMCVKNARRGASFSTDSSDRSTVECVGCGLMPQRIQKQHVQPAQHLHGFLGNVAVIRQIRRAAEPETVHRASAVLRRIGMNSTPNRSIGAPFEDVRHQARPRRLRVPLIENVGKRPRIAPMVSSEP